MSRSQRSTAWLNGTLRFHINVAKGDNERFKAVATGIEGFEGEGEHEHQAVNQLKEKLREAAVNGTL